MQRVQSDSLCRRPTRRQYKFYYVSSLSQFMFLMMLITFSLLLFSFLVYQRIYHGDPSHSSSQRDASMHYRDDLPYQTFFYILML